MVINSKKTKLKQIMGISFPKPDTEPTKVQKL